MANKHQKGQKQQKQQPTPQPTTPAKPVELTDEQLEQVVGGYSVGGGGGDVTTYCAEGKH